MTRSCPARCWLPVGWSADVAAADVTVSAETVGAAELPVGELAAAETKLASSTCPSCRPASNRCPPCPPASPSISCPQAVGIVSCVRGWPSWAPLLSPWLGPRPQTFGECGEAAPELGHVYLGSMSICGQICLSVGTARSVQKDVPQPQHRTWKNSLQTPRVHERGVGCGVGRVGAGGPGAREGLPGTPVSPPQLAPHYKGHPQRSCAPEVPHPVRPHRGPERSRRPLGLSGECAQAPSTCGTRPEDTTALSGPPRA